MEKGFAFFVLIQGSYNTVANKIIKNCTVISNLYYVAVTSYYIFLDISLPKG